MNERSLRPLMLEDPRSPVSVLSRIETELEANTIQIEQTEYALTSNDNKNLLLKKYEALRKDRHILLEGRNEAISEFHALLPDPKSWTCLYLDILSHLAPMTVLQW